MQMSEPELRSQFLLVLERQPGLLFDIIPLLQGSQSQDIPADQPPPPNWCTCTNCKEMPTDVERKCCGANGPQYCVSTLPHMNHICLDSQILQVARATRNDIFGLRDEALEPGQENRQFRHAAYRQFVVWQWGMLGSGNRVVIPSCAVWKIRDTFPDPFQQYVGFIPGRL